MTALRFKVLVHQGRVDAYAALMADGTLMETALHRVHRRPEWHPLPTGDMATPIQSLASRGGEMLVAVDAKRPSLATGQRRQSGDARQVHVAPARLARRGA
jgi:hypothetical protein